MHKLAVLNLFCFALFVLVFFADNFILYRKQISRFFFFSTGLVLIAYRILLLMKMMFFSIKSSKDLIARYGHNSWVLITGSSDGIGKAFAFELAGRGFNIVLLSRNREKLEKVEAELKFKHPSTQTRIVVRDLTKADEEGFAEGILEEVKDLDISIVINNAGMLLRGSYVDHSVEDIRDMITINCLAVAIISRIFLPKLGERKQKTALINLSSRTYIHPMPHLQVYASSKAFVDFLSTGLTYENPNIDVFTVRPALVYTSMAKGRKTDYLTIEPEEAVKGALKALGSVHRTYGFWKHSLEGWIHRCMPSSIKYCYFERMGKR